METECDPSLPGQLEANDVDVLSNPLSITDFGMAMFSCWMCHLSASAHSLRLGSRNFNDRRLVEKSRSAKRRIGGDRDAEPAGSCHQFALVQPGMMLDLIGHDRLIGDRHGLFQKLGREVRNADMAREAATLRIAEGKHLLAERTGGSANG